MSDRTRTRPVPNHAAAAVYGVEPGEIELIVGLADGDTVKALAARIARARYVSPKTVIRQLTALRRRTGTQTPAHLVAWSYQRGVLEVFVG